MTNTLKFIKELPADSEECIEWPFSTYPNGCGQIRQVGLRGSGYAHRVSLYMHIGEPPNHNSECAHSCGNRSCVNPRHLRWATARENGQDRILHGTSGKGRASSLTKHDVLNIFHADEPQSSLAQKFGVSQSSVSRIKSGETWGWLTGAQVKQN